MAKRVTKRKRVERVKYKLIFQKSEESGRWGVTIPELPDFSVESDRLERAAVLAEEKLTQYLERLEEGNAKDFPGKLLFRLEPTLHKLLFAQAKRSGMSINQYLRELVREKVGK